MADVRLPGGPSADLVGAAVALGALVGYTLAVDPVVLSAGQIAYPLVWLGVSAVALRRYVWPTREALSIPALGVGLGYAVVLLWTAGLLGRGGGDGTVSLHMALPGWGPALVYEGVLLSASVIPFLVVGYGTLGLLAAVALQRTWGASVPGILGLFACVSCTAPVVAGVVGSVGAGSVAAAVAHAQYPVATVAFLLAVGTFAVVLSTVPEPTA